MENLLTPNFGTVTNCEAFRLTSQMLNKALDTAKTEGREYAWAPLDVDYWLPEKTDFNYEHACPNFTVILNPQSINKSLTLDVICVFESYQGYQNRLVLFVTVFQVKGTQKLEELMDVGRMFAYMRFCARDDYRDIDIKWWNQFLSTHAVSSEAILLFQEDKSAAQAWAEQTFSNNSYNALVGKCGEFVFAGWAEECGLPVSRVDLKHHPEGTDEYDFSHTVLFGGKLKLDIKTFQIQEGERRNWWNVGESCLEGSHKQDVIIFTVIDEDFRMGKVVGYLRPDEIKRQGNYMPPFDDCNPYSLGYYRVYLKDIQNHYYLRALFDLKNQFFNGLGFTNFSPHKALTEMIKDYPLDPIVAHRLGINDLHTPHRGGMRNLTAKPTLRMFVPLH